MCPPRRARPRGSWWPAAIVGAMLAGALVWQSSAAVFTANTANPTNSWTLGYFAFDAATIDTWAGTGTAGYSGDGGAGTAAQINQPAQMAVDASGNLYIADINNNRIRKVTSGGTISTFAGTGTASFSGDGGAATSATLNGPRGVAIDTSGVIYIADSANHRIRKVTTGGVISTIAGTGTAGYSGDGGAATSAQLNTPRGLAVDASGNIYVADTSNNRIRRISSGGVISTVAGTGTASYSGDGGAATSATINGPYDIALDGSGCVYLADTNNNRIRKFCLAGSISTVAGTGTASYSGDGGAATSATLNGPTGVALDTAGVLYISDFANNRLRKIKPTGTITTIAGTGAATSTGDGGPATSATIYAPRSLVISSNHLYVAEQGNNFIRVLTG